ncbi:MAG: HDOD domain-containing protein [Thermodesulfobacteriota bacterium]|nr:HDOD domain-containing protein [Thermodesulfobacteriota bacterium]
MSNTTLERMVQDIQELPLLPTVVGKLLDVIGDPQSELRDVACIISKDQTLTAKVLKLVNSAFYGFSSKISTISRAVVILGYNTIKHLVLGLSVIGIIKDRDSCSHFNGTMFWEHSLGCAACARLIAKRIGYAQPEEAFTAGLLHDIGKVIFDRHFSNDFNQVMECMERDHISMIDAEEKILGVTHPMMGEWLAKTWKLPPVLCDSIRYHHSPPISDKKINESAVMCSSIVHISNILCKIEKSETIDLEGIQSIDSEIWKCVNIEEIKGETILVEIDEEIEKSKVFFGIGEETESK